MNLSVTYKQNISNGVDAASLKEVTQQIFQRANAQNSALSNLDLTKFNRATLGTDLYSNRTDVSTAIQIAVTNAGLQVNLSENAQKSLKYLSSEASKSIFKTVEGKVTIATTEEIAQRQTIPERPVFGKLTETTDLDSDKRGSNPFYKGELLKVKKEEEIEDKANIFA